MTVLLAQLYALMCLATVAFQLLLIAGLPLGEYTQGGQRKGALPPSGRVLAALSILLLAFMALSILSAAGFAGGFWPRWTGWGAVGLSAMTCTLNWITRSRKERRLWAPITTVMLALAAYVMIMAA
ncbi:hypothetical protein TG4357_02727 [Thalassovita gelatinovora]|uniref:DUF3325 domain-containing protein n=1 Tax=Thalassovita gelatinovora TaxID=53501 RepID=A0A0P1G558_THAGE|nr:hypothetical protein [Thalassovita gelatinovora]QIZ79848.1 hypothetical protein HFZ77_04800 [Thalassovita gelatinovora]CUH66937.1 hypothetical protein TG4357_02727 [Thalassovita gelatinovora]SEQ45410.1 hypothetical protein SAMN04488043_105264 [Thalassovita gelatinovora]